MTANDVYDLETAPVETIFDKDSETVLGVIDADPRQPIKMGRGYDSLTGRLRGNSVKHVTESTEQGGQQIEYKLVHIESFESLRQELGMSFSASFDGFTGGFRAKYSQIRRSEFNRYSIFVLVHVKVMNAIKSLDDFLLRDEAIRVIKENTLEQFYKTYGDEFIVGVNTGGEFYGILEFVSQSQSEKESMSLEIGGYTGNFTAQAEFTKNFSKMLKKKVTRVKIYKRGGNSKIPEGKQLAKAAAAFPAEVDPKTRKEITLSFTTIDYNTVSNMPDSIRFPDLTLSKNMLERLATDKDMALNLKNDIKYILEFPNQFKNMNEKVLTEKMVTIDKILKDIEINASKIVQEPFKEISIPEYPFSEILPLPKRESGEIPLSIIVRVERLGDVKHSEKEWAGTIGQKRPIKGIALKFKPKVPGLGIVYDCVFGILLKLSGGSHFENRTGENGAMCTIDDPHPLTHWIWLQGLSIKLKGPKAKDYDVLYKAHTHTIGPIPRGSTGIFMNGQFCGWRENRGLIRSRFIEAISVWVQPKS